MEGVANYAWRDFAERDGLGEKGRVYGYLASGRVLHAAWSLTEDFESQFKPGLPRELVGIAQGAEGGRRDHVDVAIGAMEYGTKERKHGIRRVVGVFHKSLAEVYLERDLLQRGINGA